MRISTAVSLLLIMLVWAAALTGLYYVVSLHIAKPESNPFIIVAYVAALVALAGWMFQSWVAIRNSRKQHTINVLFQTRMSNEFNKHVANIQTYFPSETNITLSVIDDLPDKSLIESVRFVLNYYEFIAVGIKHGDLDERLLRDCICSQMCRFCNRADDVIRSARGEDAFGRCSPEKARILQNLRTLQRRWQRRIDRNLKRALR